MSIALSVPVAPLSGTSTLTYSLTGIGTRDVLIEYSLDAGATWSGAAPAANCPTNKGIVAPGTYSYLWDTVADAVNGNVTVRVSSGSVSSRVTATVANSGLSFLNRSASVDASVTPISYANVHRGHYDLSPVVQNMLGDPAFSGLCSTMGLRSWRISVGRWEIGPVAIMAPEAAAYSTNTTELRNCSREYYRGPVSIPGAQNPANYNFSYLDQVISSVEACGALPYLCFDYMPFTLAANQDPNTALNLYTVSPDMSFSNGIRTSPPINNAVYAEVVTRVMMHVNGSFANGLNRSISYVEIGNEPDLPQPIFWTGSRAQFSSMYQACSASLAAQFGTSIRIGGGSFALPGQPFMNDFLANLGGTRMDFLGFHAYRDDVETDFLSLILAAKNARDTFVPSAELHCSEWGMNLDGGPKFQNMTSALHHAKVIEYFTLFGVTLSHRALLQDPIMSMGDITTKPGQLKPAGEVFAAYELLSQTPNLASITSTTPAGKPMIIVGRSSDAITLLFFHEKPPMGQVGSFTVTIANPGFVGSYAVDRWLLTDATCANHDGLWHTGLTQSSGDFNSTLQFTEDTLIVLRLSPTPFVPKATN